MAWVADATSVVERKTSGITNPETWSHTCSGSDRLLVVGINHFQNTSTISGVTYNGVSMTQLATFSPQDRGGSRFSFFYLVGPATGTNTVSVSFSSAPSQFGAVGASYTGIDQTPTIQDSDGTNYTAASGSLSFTGLTTGALIVAVGGTQGDNMNAGSGTTLRVRQTGAGIKQTAIVDLSAASSSDTVDVTHNSDNSGLIGAVFAEAGGGGGAATPTLMMLGIGS